ncbi:MAG: NACHT domain-containing protein [Anaerolineae bacterium]|nr:NACHT domain-containing protein [Anaerolineae bacterium]
MTDPNILLQRLRRSLHILEQRQAKLGLDAPASLTLEIEDHRTAITLTEQLAAGHLSDAGWREQLKPLLVIIEERRATEEIRTLHIGGVNFGSISDSTISIGDIDASIHAGGDVVGGNKVTIGQQIINFFSSSTEQQRHLRNRQIMLQRVHDFWIKGVLESSLHNEVLIELGMEIKSEAVAYPWDMIIQRPDQPNRTLPPGTKIIDVFDESGGSLLILGEPGSGKTTILLELTRQIVGRARLDLTKPIPVVFNLSSWTKGQWSLEDWLVEELSAKYNFPEKISRSWINNDELLPLLDGLDEVEVNNRTECVKAINTYSVGHGLPGLVVSSRTADYEVLGSLLRLNTAIVLQPLTWKQIENYLLGSTVKMDSVRRMLEKDVVVQSLAQSPLILNVITLAYSETSIDTLSELKADKDRRKKLFDAYIIKLFRHRLANQRYAQKQTIAWLAWLAKKMFQYRQTIFLMEQTQPNWLPSSLQIWLYNLLVMILVGGTVGLLFGLAVGIPIWFANPLIGPFFGIGVGSAVAMSICLAIIQTYGFTGGLIVGGTFGFVFFVAFGLNFGRPVGVAVGLIVGLAFGLAHGLRFGTRPANTKAWTFPNIEIFEALSWSIPKAIRGMIFGSIFGSIFGLAVGAAIAIGLNFEPNIAGKLTLNFLVAFGVAAGLVAGMLNALTSDQVEQRSVPNQGIWRSFRNSIVIGLFVAIASGFPIGVVSGWAWNIGIGIGNEGLRVGSFTGLLVGVAIGLAVGLAFGGLTTIQHFILRSILYFFGYLPWNLTDFLDYTTERIFLRRVGGGYIFIHRYLMEYFASLTDEDIERLSAEIETGRT